MKHSKALNARPCIVCGQAPTDIAHIKSRGSGGGDGPENTVPLCRGHHRIQHSLGWARFARENGGVMAELVERGWGFNGWGKLIRTRE